jgi:hypothetical protein
VDDDFVCGMEQSVWITLAVASSTVRTKSRHSMMEPMELSHCWGIGLLTAQKTLRVTTQKVDGTENFESDNPKRFCGLLFTRCIVGTARSSSSSGTIV